MELKNLNYKFHCIEDFINKAVKIPIIGRIAGLTRILLAITQVISAISILIFEILRTRTIDPASNSRLDFLYDRPILNFTLGAIEFTPFFLYFKFGRTKRKFYLKLLNSNFARNEDNVPSFEAFKIDKNNLEIALWNNGQLPQEISKIIEEDIKDIKPRYFLPEEIKACAKQLLGAFSTNKHFNAIFAPTMNDLKKTLYLTEKYHAYSLQYRNEVENRIATTNPHLIDALGSGSNYKAFLGFYTTTFHAYTPRIEDEIKEIVRLMPQSINCRSVKIGAIKNASPLYAACLNTSVPLHIIEFLLKNGADTKAQTTIFGENFTILKLLKLYSGEYDWNRYNCVKELFKKYA